MMGKAAFCLSLVLVVACGPPIGVVRLDPQEVYREIGANVLSTGRPSLPTRIVLQERGLGDRYDDAPAEVLALLHQELVGTEGSGDLLFALAELSFEHASHGGGAPFYLATTVYAWAFLFEDAATDRLDVFDPRGRLTADLYNTGLARAFATHDGTRVDLRAGSFALPFGTVEVSFDRDELRWGGRTLANFSSASDLGVRGLRNRYREPGLGAPLNAGTEAAGSDAKETRFVIRNVRVPTTVLLRLSDVRTGLRTGRIAGRLDIYTAGDVERVTIADRSVPLEFEPTSALASMLAESPVWERELRGFLRGDLVMRQGMEQLAALAPHHPGLIPVVLVHGTASSPARWAELVNDLSNDPQIRQHFEFWAFTYDTGNPITYSAMVLREALAKQVRRLDRAGDDHCLHRMVVIGHSQGGLLTKLTAVESGERFWRNASNQPFEQAELSPTTRDLLQRALFVSPLPFVTRLIYVATPHRGSYRAGGIVRNLIERLVAFPSDVTRVGTDLLENDPAGRVARQLNRLPTSVDNMAPGSPFVQALSTLPIASGVTSHSIIAVKGDGPPEAGNDGVVQYTSAHLDDVASELVVRSAHSVQGNPYAIEEVRRILLLHARESFAEHGCVPAAQQEEK